MTLSDCAGFSGSRYRDSHKMTICQMNEASLITTDSRYRKHPIVATMIRR